MVLALFGGLLFGSGAAVLFQRESATYPKPIATVFVLVGIALIIVGTYTPSLLF